MKALLFSVIPFALIAAPIRPIIIPPSSLISTDVSHLGEDEVAIISRLIGTTQEQLKKEEHLKELMVHFKSEREAFSLGDYSKKRAAQMVGCALEILDLISDLHVQHLFPVDYLEEIKVFSSIASKNQIKRPS